MLQYYQSNKKLPLPSGCPVDIYTLMKECWDLDPYRRKKPQAIMRDVNQILHQGIVISTELSLPYILKSSFFTGIGCLKPVPRVVSSFGFPVYFWFFLYLIFHWQHICKSFRDPVFLHSL